MVKTVIKAIKAAGIGLNGSPDCFCCNKLNWRQKKKHEEMVKTWKDRIKKDMQQEKKNEGIETKNCSSVGEQNVISCAQTKAGSYMALNWFLFTADEIKGYGAPTITFLSKPRQGALSHYKRQRARSSSQCDAYLRSFFSKVGNACVYAYSMCVWPRKERREKKKQRECYSRVNVLIWYFSRATC